MDVLFRLRVLIWVLVLGLWGVMVYQFLGEEEAEKNQMAFIENPYKGKALPQPGPGAPEQGHVEQPPPPAPVAEASQQPAVDPQLAQAQAAAQLALANSPGIQNVPAGASSLDYIKPLPLQRPMPQQHKRAHPSALRREQRMKQQAEQPVPEGFVKTATRHFNIYGEGDPASEQFIALLENLHGNLMLDLANFSPWAAQEKVTVFLFKNQDTYRKVTGRPAWSGGASSVTTRRVFVYESEELPGILAHELCHIYFDGFFLEGKGDPLWLSEGMATLIQVERGMAAPEWLRENLEILERGGGFTTAEMMSVNSTADSTDDKVRLWYAQAYSTVRFLIRSQYKSNFYHFAEYLREGKDPTQALYRAYGMPYNRLKALEYAWRYELASNSLSRLSSDR